jgi:hypothetical protein
MVPPDEARCIREGSSTGVRGRSMLGSLHPEIATWHTKIVHLENTLPSLER